MTIEQIEKYISEIQKQVAKIEEGLKNINYRINDIQANLDKIHNAKDDLISKIAFSIISIIIGYVMGKVLI